MNADFGARLRELLKERGVSLRGAARALNYDVAYLSRVVNGRQRSSPQLAAALDELLNTGGELTDIIQRPVHPRSDEPSGPASDIAHMKASAAYVLQHADRHGGDTVAMAAVQVWRCAQQKLDNGEIPDQEQRPYLAAVSEAAEVAGWLLFDSGQRETARRAFLESHMLARHAGDAAMQWFALDMLAMLDTECGRPGETRRIADELLAERRLPPRVALMARVRRGRALAQVGDRHRAMADLSAARAGLEDSLSPRDPAWAWWVNHYEVTGHAGHVLLSLEDTSAAINEFHTVLEHATPRGAMLYRIALLRGYVRSKAWREAEEELHHISPLLKSISSGRNRLLLSEALRGVLCSEGTPRGLGFLAKEITAEISQSTF
ncbi:helix-turn-helix domain-containing protein [Actinomycetota bacterium Odt1-20B]